MTIKYGIRSIQRQYFSNLFNMVKYPIPTIKSLYDVENNKDVGCMMCVKDERLTVVPSILSTMNIVSRYVIIDKNGLTIPTVKRFADLYNLSVDYYVKRNLDLRQSRKYALNKIDETWLMIIDGDEILINHDEIKMNMKNKNTYLRSKKKIILSDGSTPLLNSGYHNFLYHNNDSIRIINKPEYDIRIRDIPIMKGRGIMLKNICILNMHIK